MTMYTVKEMSELSNVTIKTLHHYHKIGLLPPAQVSDAGYRLYGMKELERLQQILFYRELDFPLERIKRLLDAEPDRLAILSEQRSLLLERKRRLERLTETIEASIAAAAAGEPMERGDMFRGFSEDEWNEALAGQRQYVKDAYGYDMTEEAPVDAESLNGQAREAIRFMDGMAASLRDGLKHDDERVRRLVKAHIAALNENGHPTTAESFAAQARFFVSDDFHRSIFEDRQTGLAYYIAFAAESFAGSPAGGN
ncbi:MerR family transcriptional regulator [Paenibacillus sp. GYB003]|uniref:MerR family transcriptional regulator n=1 Tax=Paenibacillus sp. GYB003 TaxID=2994392 RepID=UPI002F966E28